MAARMLRCKRFALALAIALAADIGRLFSAATSDAPELFRADVAPVLERRCLSCHSGSKPKGGLSLETAANLAAGGESGAAIVAGRPEDSLLVQYISGSQPEMPKDQTPLAESEVAAVRRWVAAGAEWPDGLVLEDKRQIDAAWWSLLPIVRPDVPQVNSDWPITPIDAFLWRELKANGLSPSDQADRRTLIRRLSVDLVGLPPSPEEVRAFIADSAPDAYERLVDRLLNSPAYGERWARHWLDVVHYGDTHGFDKDKVRPNAWPYRDYVVRAFNRDKPYAQFVQEQLVGDTLAADPAEGIVALGFIAAGPFDFVGHIEVPESKAEGRASRNLDRDDMVRTTMETFASVTVGCARCHNHKFDPITQEDYYSLQAVFAAVDRAERSFDADPAVASKRGGLEQQKVSAAAQFAAWQQQVRAAAGPELDAIDGQIAALSSPAAERPQFGYHSLIEPKPDVVKWVEVDLGQSLPIDRVELVGCHDDFNGIGAGFGFPPRYKIELANDTELREVVACIVDHSHQDAPNPGVAVQSFPAGGTGARYVRVTATKLAERQQDYILALGELMVFAADGANVAHNAKVIALDSIEAPARWSKANLVDGYYVGAAQGAAEDRNRLAAERAALLASKVSLQTRQSLEASLQQLQSIESELAKLPAPSKVFAAATHFKSEGAHIASEGRPRAIAILHRGEIDSPRQAVTAGALACIRSLPARFEGESGANESRRRAALAEWLAHRDNPLTWRSIVNRVWQYHFGRGIVETPNDFGRMGSRPSHGELLDYLAAWFRDDAAGSLKSLHRLMVTSAAYRQSSAWAGNRQAAESLDADNRLLWRMNPRRLEAEALRDAVLTTAGKLDHRMGGPGFFAFGFKDDHSPHYLYEDHDPDDPVSWRRSIYRFIVRSVPDPFMETLDCADPSLLVDRRNETLTALQALALLNNRFMLRMSQHFAARVDQQAGAAAPWEVKIAFAFDRALERPPTAAEVQALLPVAAESGLAGVCRVLLNTNEFLFVD